MTTPQSERYRTWKLAHELAWIYVDRCRCHKVQNRSYVRLQAVEFARLLARQGELQPGAILGEGCPF